MTPSPSKRGSSVEAMPVPVAKEKLEAKPVRPKTKQTIEIGRRAFSRIRSQCVEQGISFQEFAIRGLNKELHSLGEPSIEELEVGE